MAKKQSLVGICFAGVQTLVDSDVEDYCGMSELQYLTWMGMAAKIQQRNEIVSRQCVELCNALEKEQFRACVLKGQGTANLYGNIATLRQSGDIDVWVMPKDVRTIKESRPCVTEFVHRRFPDEKGAFCISDSLVTQILRLSCTISLRWMVIHGWIGGSGSCLRIGRMSALLM